MTVNATGALTFDLQPALKYFNFNFLSTTPLLLLFPLAKSPLLSLVQLEAYIPPTYKMPLPTEEEFRVKYDVREVEQPEEECPICSEDVCRSAAIPHAVVRY